MPSLRADREIAMAAVQRHGRCDRSGDIEAFNTLFACVFRAAELHFMSFLNISEGYSLNFASPQLRADRELVLKAVRQYGAALAASELQDDREVVQLAVRRNGCSLRYASEELKSESSLARKVLEITQDVRFRGDLRACRGLTVVTFRL